MDRPVGNEHDNPTIGLLLCRNKRKAVAEYKLAQSLPAELQTSLPSIEQIERELARMDDGEGET